MAIDFHAAANSRTYSGRDAHVSWRDLVTRISDPVGAAVVDVGCGGGTYTRAWHELGARSVTGVDFSAPLLDAARDSHADLTGVDFVHGEAAATGLPDESADIVFERALVHHVADLGAVVDEAARLLRPGGTYLIQDRTADDAFQPGSTTHPRGWFFDVFPRLKQVEAARRPERDAVVAELRRAGFVDVLAHALWETRRVHADREEYLDDVRLRTGRSILHDLSDREIGQLVDELRRRLPAGRVVERDKWTVWRGQIAPDGAAQRERRAGSATD